MRPLPNLQTHSNPRDVQAAGRSPFTMFRPAAQRRIGTDAVTSCSTAGASGQPRQDASFRSFTSTFALANATRSPWAAEQPMPYAPARRLRSDRAAPKDSYTAVADGVASGRTRGGSSFVNTLHVYSSPSRTRRSTPMRGEFYRRTQTVAAHREALKSQEDQFKFGGRAVPAAMEPPLSAQQGGGARAYRSVPYAASPHPRMHPTPWRRSVDAEVEHATPDGLAAMRSPGVVEEPPPRESSSGGILSSALRMAKNSIKSIFGSGGPSTPERPPEAKRYDQGEQPGPVRSLQAEVVFGGDLKTTPAGGVRSAYDYSPPSGPHRYHSPEHPSMAAIAGAPTRVAEVLAAERPLPYLPIGGIEPSVVGSERDVSEFHSPTGSPQRLFGDVPFDLQSFGASPSSRRFFPSSGTSPPPQLSPVGYRPRTVVTGIDAVSTTVPSAPMTAPSLMMDAGRRFQHHGPVDTKQIKKLLAEQTGRGPWRWVSYDEFREAVSGKNGEQMMGPGWLQPPLTIDETKRKKKARGKHKKYRVPSSSSSSSSTSSSVSEESPSSSSESAVSGTDESPPQRRKRKRRHHDRRSKHKARRERRGNMCLSSMDHTSGARGRRKHRQEKTKAAVFDERGSNEAGGPEEQTAEPPCWWMSAGLDKTTPGVESAIAEIAKRQQSAEQPTTGKRPRSSDDGAQATPTSTATPVFSLRSETAAARQTAQAPSPTFGLSAAIEIPAAPVATKPATVGKPAEPSQETTKTIEQLPADKTSGGVPWWLANKDKPVDEGAFLEDGFAPNAEEGPSPKSTEQEKPLEPSPKASQPAEQTTEETKPAEKADVPWWLANKDKPVDEAAFLEDGFAPSSGDEAETQTAKKGKNDGAGSVTMPSSDKGGLTTTSAAEVPKGLFGALGAASSTSTFSKPTEDRTAGASGGSIFGKSLLTTPSTTAVQGGLFPDFKLAKESIFGSTTATANGEEKKLKTSIFSKSNTGTIGAAATTMGATPPPELAKPTTGGLFGSLGAAGPPSGSSTSIFGSGTTQPAASTVPGSIFGSTTASATASGGSSLFGKPTAPSLGGSIFGSDAGKAEASTTDVTKTGLLPTSSLGGTSSIFSQPSTGAPGGSLFGSSASSPPGTTASQPGSTTPLAGMTGLGGTGGSTLFGGQPSAAPTGGTGLFGSTSATGGGIFGGTTSTTRTNETGGGFSFGQPAAPNANAFGQAGGGFSFGMSQSSPVQQQPASSMFSGAGLFQTQPTTSPFGGQESKDGPSTGPNPFAASGQFSGRGRKIVRIKRKLGNN